MFHYVELVIYFYLMEGALRDIYWFEFEYTCERIWEIYRIIFGGNPFLLFLLVFLLLVFKLLLVVLVQLLRVNGPVTYC